jgi:hypothetical protein
MITENVFEKWGYLQSVQCQRGWRVAGRPRARRRVIVLIVAQRIMASETAERRDGSLRRRDVLSALRPCLARERCSEPS